ncbi:hypothetical protein EK21DRAFT_112067 [Setomelanomma holmii]|uniref:Uncharacterized protein n=1 Tax=Setomelanomma holmii TaxID=210430 RepID=A0A9P4LKG2_9PLEO|nr:hypothetical protein EK21DRAFT_112067 [Setomelanomma holmii]
MPIDRNPQNNLKPKLASNRTAKTPLTPRLAAAPTPASANSSQSNRTVRSGTATTPRVNTTSFEDVTPVKAFLNSNVTPRSSSRKSRVGVESPTSTPSGTPISTPASSRPTSTIDFPTKEQGIGYNALGVGNKGAQSGARPRSIPGQGGNQAQRPPLSNIYNSGPSESGSAKPTSPLFFHASDVRPQEQPAPQKKAPLFFYANGKQDETTRRHEAPSPPVPTTGQSQVESKFFHADSIADARNPTPAMIPSPMSVSPEPLDPSSNVAPGQTFRPPSPTKEWAHLSYRKGASQVMRPSIVSRNSALSILSGPNPQDVPDISRRRSSAASHVIRASHSKSASLSSIDSVADLKMAPANDPSAFSPSPLHSENRLVSNGSLADSIPSAPSPPPISFSPISSPPPASPTKPSNGQSALEMMNELAANARRERKVLDLEISNSSLLAINRGLEKEVRKQKAELRRFRRMSRAGRFSMDTAGSPLEVGARIGELSDMSEGEEELDPEPEAEEANDDPDSSDSSFDESQLSPSAQLERDEVHRFRDEKHLQLDLSKHRELLVDSQKMNQSLKRCMNWTEQLIKDGQKALEYQVRPSDVKLGGRVLVSEDDHDAEHAEESKGLLSPWSPLHRSIDGLDALESPFFANAVERIVDRDSGVDIDALDVPDSVAHLDSPFEERIQRLQASIEALGAS